ncbi:hypothetical protein ACFL22_00890 [Patescibacteria group bacterium]
MWLVNNPEQIAGSDAVLLTVIIVFSALMLFSIAKVFIGVANDSDCKLAILLPIFGFIWPIYPAVQRMLRKIEDAEATNVCKDGVEFIKGVGCFHDGFMMFMDGLVRFPNIDYALDHGVDVSWLNTVLDESEKEQIRCYLEDRQNAWVYIVRGDKNHADKRNSLPTDDLVDAFDRCDNIRLQEHMSPENPEIQKLVGKINRRRERLGAMLQHDTVHVITELLHTHDVGYEITDRGEVI